MPTFADVSLQLPLDGSDGSTAFTDVSLNGLTPAAIGAAQIDTAQSKWGGSSLEVAAATGLLVTPQNAAFGFGTSAWTVEAWVRLTEFGLASNVFDFPTDALGSTPRVLMVIDSSGYICIRYDGGALIGSGVGASSMALNTWNHVAWCFDGTTVRMFLNGSTVFSFASSYDFGAARRIYIGTSHTGATYVTGHIDDVRVTKAAWYTTDFSVPTEAFPYGSPTQTGTHTSSAPSTAFGTAQAGFNQDCDASSVAPATGAGTPALNLNLSYAANTIVPTTRFGAPVSDRGDIPAPIVAKWIAPSIAFGAAAVTVTRDAVASGMSTTAWSTPTARIRHGATGSAFGAFGTPKLNEQGLATGFSATALGAARCLLPSPSAGFTRTAIGSPRARTIFAGAATGWTGTQLGTHDGDGAALSTRSALFRTAFGRAQAERTAV